MRRTIYTDVFKPSQPALLDIALQMRYAGFMPYHRMTVEGREMEVISMPFPAKYGVGVMLREPDDPTTMREFRLWETLPTCVQCGKPMENHTGNPDAVLCCSYQCFKIYTK